MNDSTDDEPIRIRVDPELASLIPGYLDNRRHDVTSLFEALDRGDYETARNLGHNMRGTGGGYGFDGITDIGGEIERAAKQGDAVLLRTHVESLSLYLARLELVTDDTSPMPG